MAVPTTSWDETSPAGSDALNNGDNRMREMKTQVREVIDVDHKFASSGSDADNGCHDQVTLLEKADLGTGAVGKTILGSQTVSGKGELVYTDEDNNDIVMSILGTPVAINQCTAKTTPTGADLILLSDSADSYKSKKMTIANLLNAVYPVGSVVTLGVSTNPATLFGIGTWSAIAGRVIVGIDAGQTEFDTLDETGGAKTHTLSTAEMPAHTHTVSGYSPNSGGTATLQGSPAGADVTVTTSSTGSGDAHNNLQPYIIKYVWQRTA